MLVSFAYCFRQRPSGTGNNEPPASLNSAEADLARSPEAVNPSQPANRRLSPSCGPEGGDGYLIN